MSCEVKSFSGSKLLARHAGVVMLRLAPQTAIITSVTTRLQSR